MYTLSLLQVLPARASNRALVNVRKELIRTVSMSIASYDDVDVDDEGMYFPL